MAAGNTGHDLEPDPGLGARGGFAGRAVQQRVAADQPDREVAVLGGLDQHPAVAAASAGSARRASGLMWRRAMAARSAGSDDQAGLAEQLGRAHRQQPLVTRAGARQGDPPGGGCSEAGLLDAPSPSALTTHALTAHHSRCSSVLADC